MSVVASVVLLFVLVAVAASRPVLNDDIVNQINSNPASTWTAARNPRFENMTLDEFIKNFLGAKLVKPKLSSKTGTKPPWRAEDTQAIRSGLPVDFDGRQAWGACVHQIMNQGNCGSCWAFGATECLSDRLCIWSRGAINQILSPQDLVSCDHYSGDSGCAGGELVTAWEFMRDVGVVNIQCFPYFAQDVACPSACYNGEQPVLFHAANVYAVPASDIAADIYTHGPVEAAFEVYEDFVHYAGGVYQHTSGGALGGHAIKMLGWGVAGGLPYWLCANSWGPGWGPYGGFFLIRRGVNECGIEQYVTAGYPRV